MSEIKLSARAQQVLAWCHSSESWNPPLDPSLRWGDKPLAIRQQSLAELFGCSRRSIGRALNELKAAGLLVDLGRRENRCKVYRVTPAEAGVQTMPAPTLDPSLRWDDTQAIEQLRLYRYTFESVFSEWPDWEKYYPEVTWELRGITDAHMLFRQTFDKLYVLRAASTYAN